MHKHRHRSSEIQDPRVSSLPLVAPHPPLRNLVWHHLEKKLAQKLVHRNLWKGLAQKFVCGVVVTKGTEESLPSPWLPPPPPPEKLGVAKGLAQKFEISSCVLKLATKNVGTRNEKMWSQKFVWLALEKGLAQKFVIQKFVWNTYWQKYWDRKWKMWFVYYSIFWGGRQIIFWSDDYILVQYKMESLPSWRKWYLDPNSCLKPLQHHLPLTG